MPRSFVHEALVLSVRASGEANREASFLTAEEGIIRATVFGGPKSKLRAHVASFHEGTLYLYRDPVRDSRKVVDFDVRSWRPLLRESLERTWAASALSETILASHGGGGSWVQALSLANDTLDALEVSDDAGSQRSLLRFLWKWTELLGARPDDEGCCHCACRLSDDEVVWYSRYEGAFFCDSCVQRRGVQGLNEEGLLPLGSGARKWFKAVENVDARSALRISLDSGAQAKRLVTEILGEALGRRLTTWDACGTPRA
ncbi:DNA repair protein RecO C-terminal domain-containing protein [Treponema sp.]